MAIERRNDWLIVACKTGQQPTLEAAGQAIEQYRFM
jgi:hypothetical protein